MNQPLYCGADGCSLHDYDVAPIFCEYEYQKQQARRIQQNEERRFNRLLERIVEVLGAKLGDAVFDAIEQNDEDKYSSRNRRAETPPAPTKRIRRGRIST